SVAALGMSREKAKMTSHLEAGLLHGSSRCRKPPQMGRITHWYRALSAAGFTIGTSGERRVPATAPYVEAAGRLVNHRRVQSRASAEGTGAPQRPRLGSRPRMGRL